MKNKFNERCLTEGEVNLIFNSRIAWRRITTWLRIYIFSTYAGIGSTEEIFGRLYLESAELGDLVQLHFGLENSRRYAQLINQYTIILRDLLQAHQKGDADAVQYNVNRLYQNADETAAFLSAINPYFDETEWRNLLKTYAQYTIEEANGFASGNYSKVNEYFDRLVALSNRMGDAFAQGVYDYLIGLRGDEHFQPQNNEQCITYDQMNAIYEIRMLWFELVTWTRFYILVRYLGINDEGVIYDRLKQVPVNYINSIKQIFGETNSERALELLNTYIDLLDAYLTAQAEGNQDEVNRITQLLYENADERAEFLASINPFWDQNEWRARLDKINQYTIAQFNSLLTQSYAQNLDIFSTLLDLADSTSDYYAQGLYNLFKSTEASSFR